MCYKWIFLLGLSAMLGACSQTVNSFDDEDSLEISSSAKKGASSSSKGGKATSSATEEPDDDCVGEPGKVWDGTTAKNFACGAGTKLSPYVILTAEQLAKLSFVIGANDKAYQGKYYKLGADIVLNKGKIIDDKGGFVADSAKLHKWTPIGNSSVSFTGLFDGDGHSVSGMFINTTSTHNGLFGNSSGTVSNLVLKNGWIFGGNASGGIVGQSGGSIINVENYISVTGSNESVGGIAGQSNGPYPKYAYITSCKNFGIVKGKNYVGGIAGQAYQAEFENVENHGLVEGLSYVGGVVGRGGYTYVSSYFMKCLRAINYGEIYGESYIGGIWGVAGYSSPTVSAGNIIANLEYAKNEGDVHGKKYVGGIAGSSNRVTISNVGNIALVEGGEFVSGIVGNLLGSTSKYLYNTGDVTGLKYVGGIIGNNQEGVTSSAYSTGKVDGDSLVGLMIGYNFNTTMADYYYLKQGDQEPFGQNNGGGVATPKTEKEMKSKNFAELLGDDFVYDSGLNDGYPVLNWEK